MRDSGVNAEGAPGDGRQGIFSIQRIPLLEGAGFTFGMILVWVTMWSLGAFFMELPTPGIAKALHSGWHFWTGALLQSLPMVPLYVIVTNRTDPVSPRRYLYLLATVPVLWPYWGVVDWLYGDTPGIVPFNKADLPCFCMDSLVCAAVTLRSSARSAGNELRQRQIDSAALEAQVRRARMQLLRAQIEPHFLFNTLATVRGLARTDRRAAVEMLDNLMRYLSEALPMFRREESSLADELQLIAAYLRIHQVRIGARMRFEMSVAEALLMERVPTMLLLTLVENAVKHGINPCVQGGTICVSADADERTLVLQVTDSGQGLIATEGHGTGLANVRQRLSVLYGDLAMLTLGRAVPHGVVATVSLPRAV